MAAESGPPNSHLYPNPRATLAIDPPTLFAIARSDQPMPPPQGAEEKKKVSGNISNPLALFSRRGVGWRWERKIEAEVKAQ